MSRPRQRISWPPSRLRLPAGLPGRQTDRRRALPAANPPGRPRSPGSSAEQGIARSAGNSSTWRSDWRVSGSRIASRWRCRSPAPNAAPPGCRRRTACAPGRRRSAAAAAPRIPASSLGSPRSWAHTMSSRRSCRRVRASSAAAISDGHWSPGCDVCRRHAAGRENR